MARSKNRTWRWLALGLAVIVLAAVAAPFLVPISGFIPELTAVASKKIGQPVSISELRLELLPTPRVAISGLKVGKKDEIRIEEVRIVPELLPLLGGHRVVREIRAERVRVHESAPAMLRTMPKSEGGADSVAVRRVVLRDVKFEHHVLKLPEFDVEIELAANLSATQARLVTHDGRLKLTVDPEGAGKARVQLAAHDWPLPLAASPLVFESLEAQARLDASRLAVPKVSGRLYGGSLAGNVNVDWTRQWRVGGKADLAGVDLISVQKALGKKNPRLSGRLSAQASYSSTAKSPGQLVNALALDAPFEVVGGAWQGVDLSRVAELPLGKLALGGATRFEEMKGKFTLHGKRIKLDQLCVRSPTLVAGGSIEIAPDQSLSGKLDVSVAKTKGFVGFPVALRGTTSEPSIMLTKGALIGGFIGTVLLPGIGTSLGVSAGNAIEGKSDCK